MPCTYHEKKKIAYGVETTSSVCDMLLLDTRAVYAAFMLLARARCMAPWLAKRLHQINAHILSVSPHPPPSPASSRGKPLGSSLLQLLWSIRHVQWSDGKGRFSAAPPGSPRQSLAIYMLVDERIAFHPGLPPPVVDWCIRFMPTV